MSVTKESEAIKLRFEELIKRKDMHAVAKHFDSLLEIIGNADNSVEIVALAFMAMQQEDKETNS